MLISKILFSGSSPLTRGKRVDVVVNVAAERLIPAHAGKTHGARIQGARSSAHPRSRGENLQEPLIWSNVDGSSPLTRGKRASVRS